ncbi:MAG TPA: Tol-Pal system beta propeller repeat protein TolB [Acetobacteraceae bacterium]|nr:Tol-Pal system beta propeller repeat protein TolB [Acetobacteraceae bacterium]
MFLPPFSRRGFLAGGAGLLAGGPALAQSLAAPAALAPTAPAQAGGAGGQPVIDVDHALQDPIRIALPVLGGSPAAETINKVMTADLTNCGLFRPIDQAAFISAADANPTAPNFPNWKAIGAQAVVTGTVTDAGGGQTRVEFRLWDVLTQQQLQGTAYTSSNVRRIAHIMGDVIYERMLGEKGYFDTRIVYVAATGPRGRQTKRLAIMDQDAANNRILTDGQWLVLTPRFNPVRDQIAFMSYANNRPRVLLYDLNTGHQSTLGEFEGMSFAPRFSPDGASCILSVTRGGGSDIFVVDVASRAARRLTSSGSIDTSPCYSPDGSQIVFNSDRDGDQQLYIMSAGGSGARRISFGHGRYATPVWSPRGDLIAYTRLSGQTFAIGVMHPDGTGERILSESYSVEGPTFAPNGRVLMFWRETRSVDEYGHGFSSRLVSIDITGFNEREIPTPTDASDPAWSPLNT